MIRLIFSVVLYGIFTLATGFAADNQPWLGIWQEAKAADDIMVLEPNRCILQSPGGKPQFACATYSPEGEVWARGSEGAWHFRVKLNGDRLEILSGGSGTYHRLAALPPNMQIIPLAIPAAKPVAAKRKSAIVAEAAKRVQEDQAVRTDPGRRAQAGAVDADNTAWIKMVIAEVGWPDAARFGKATASTMFLFVQHSGDLPLMLGALPCIEADLKAAVCDPQDYALLYDRVQLMTGRPQRYGSQIVGDGAGKQVVFLLEDQAKVEQFRAAIGLFPLSAYLQVYEQQTGTKVGFMESVRSAE